MFQAKFDQAKYLTLGVGAVNATFTLVAVSKKSTGDPLHYYIITLATQHQLRYLISKC